MAWYEHLFGILAVLTCCALPFGGLGILLCMFSSGISRKEEDLL